MCIECEDQPIAVLCNQCNDKFCEVCFQALHKKGSRKQHTFVALVPNVKFQRSSTSHTSTLPTSNDTNINNNNNERHINEKVLI
jgi:hypothetical protein